MIWLDRRQLDWSVSIRVVTIYSYDSAQPPPTRWAHLIAWTCEQGQKEQRAVCNDDLAVEEGSPVKKKQGTGAGHRRADINIGVDILLQGCGTCRDDGAVEREPVVLPPQTLLTSPSQAPKLQPLI